MHIARRDTAGTRRRRRHPLGLRQSAQPPRSFTLYFVIARHEPKGLLLAAFFLLFALIMDLRKTFTFDARQRIVRWHGRKVFKSESGEIPFDDITEIGMETRRAGQRDVPIYRLTIITSQATIPMAYAYSGDGDRYSTLRGQILDFVKPGSTTA